MFSPLALVSPKPYTDTHNHIHTRTHARTDANELEIVQEGGLNPIILGTADAAAALDNRGAQFKGDAKEYSNLEELAAQCSRALRNLSVNRKWNMIYIYSFSEDFIR
jgi:hypothetical protein